MRQHGAHRLTIIVRQKADPRRENITAVQSTGQEKGATENFRGILKTKYDRQTKLMLTAVCSVDIAAHESCYNSC